MGRCDGHAHGKHKQYFHFFRAFVRSQNFSGPPHALGDCGRRAIGYRYTTRSNYITSHDTRRHSCGSCPMSVPQERPVAVARLVARDERCCMAGIASWRCQVSASHTPTIGSMTIDSTAMSASGAPRHPPRRHHRRRRRRRRRSRRGAGTTQARAAVDPLREVCRPAARRVEQLGLQPKEGKDGDALPVHRARPG